MNSKPEFLNFSDEMTRVLTTDKVALVTLGAQRICQSQAAHDVACADVQGRVGAKREVFHGARVAV